MKNHRKLRNILLIILVVLLIVSSLVGFVLRFGHEDTVLSVLSLLATLVGTFFIAIELKNSQVVSCCDMLIDINNYFHDNKAIMRVYEALEEEYAGKDASTQWNAVKDSDVAAYCTFFENIYLLVHNHIAKMQDIDSLFGYRFFLFMHNRRMQDYYLYPTASSYTEIFELYTVWKKYREKHGREHMIVNRENAFSDTYLQEKQYLRDRGYTRKTMKLLHREQIGDLVIKEASFNDLHAIEELQNLIVQSLPDPTLYSALNHDELVESLNLDEVYGVWQKEHLAAYLILVTNRNSDRSLASLVDENPDTYSKVLTLDAVAVDPAFRGQGLQDTLIQLVLEGAKKKPGIELVAATVSPDNPYSLKNFEKNGFVVQKANLTLYGGVTRSLLVEKLV